jgi:ubiquinone/menaquinone biosynthesis C-methylase UbiE
MMNESFDEKAKTWDEEPRRVQLGQTLFSAIEKAVPFHADTTALDYGCGTGLLTLPLAARVRHITAVDTSTGMLAVLERKAQAGGLDNIQGLRADFSTDPLPSEPVDLITSAMALHHIADTEALLLTFFQLLTPGGRLALADLDREDGSFHGSMDGIPHAGFDRDTLSGQLTAAGFAGIQFTTATRIEKNNRTYPVFLVTAQKP